MAKTKIIRAVFEGTPNSNWPIKCCQCERTTGYKCVTRRFTIHGKQEWVRYFCWNHMAQWVKRAKAPIQNIKTRKIKGKIIVVYIEQSRWLEA